MTYMDPTGGPDGGREALRQKIAANPQDPAIRSGIIAAAVHMNMADEIPPDWGVGIGASPVEAEEVPIHEDWTLQTQPYPMELVLYQDGTVSFNELVNNGQEIGESIFEANPDPTWTDAVVQGLKNALQWAEMTDFGDFLSYLGERQPDQMNGMFGWQTVGTEPGGDSGSDITVGVNASGLVTIMFPDESPVQAHSFADEETLDAAITALEECFDELGEFRE